MRVHRPEIDQRNGSAIDTNSVAFDLRHGLPEAPKEPPATVKAISCETARKNVVVGYGEITPQRKPALSRPEASQGSVILRLGNVRPRNHRIHAPHLIRKRQGLRCFLEVVPLSDLHGLASADPLRTAEENQRLILTTGEAKIMADLNDHLFKLFRGPDAWGVPAPSFGRDLAVTPFNQSHGLQVYRKNVPRRAERWAVIAAQRFGSACDEPGSNPAITFRRRGDLLCEVRDDCPDKLVEPLLIDALAPPGPILNLFDARFDVRGEVIEG
jgi:hypothetical protein